MRYLASSILVYLDERVDPSDPNSRYEHIARISVDRNDGLLSIVSTSWDHADLHEYLIDAEIAEWKRIGPEDSELFATDSFFDAVTGQQKGWHYLTQ